MSHQEFRRSLRKGWRVSTEVDQPCSFLSRKFPTLSGPQSEEQKSLSRVQLFVTPGTYTVCGILQARILKWVAFPFSSRSSQPRDGTQVSLIAGGFFTS